MALLRPIRRCTLKRTNWVSCIPNSARRFATIRKRLGNVAETLSRARPVATGAIKVPTVSRCALASCVLVAATLSACAGASEVPSSSLPRKVDADTPPDTVTHDAASPPVRIQILAINDFHGNLEPPGGSSGFVTVPPDDPWLREHPDAGASSAPDGKNVIVPAGGVAYLAAHIKRLRARNPNTWIVSAGDLNGASPLVSNLFNDEPT